MRISVKAKLLKHFFVWAFTTKFVRSIVWFPFWLQFDVVIKFLMSNEHLGITEFGCDHGSVESKVTDWDFLSSKLWWGSPSENIVEDRVCWNCFELVEIIHWITWLGVGEHCLDSRVWDKVKSPWENSLTNILSRLSILSIITKTDFISPVS